MSIMSAFCQKCRIDNISEEVKGHRSLVGFRLFVLHLSKYSKLTHQVKGRPDTEASSGGDVLIDWNRDIEFRDSRGNVALVTIADIESILLICLTRRDQEEFVRSLESTLCSE